MSKSDTDKYVQFLTGDLDSKKVRRISEAYPDPAYAIDREWIWSRSEGEDSKIRISERMENESPGLTYIYMPAVNVLLAEKLARAELKKNPSKQKNARLPF